MSETDFVPLIEPVAIFFWGEPNLKLSNSRERRWGSRGSKTADLRKGVWYDNEAGTGGGVLDLVSRETGCTAGRAAVEWLREHGFEVGGDDGLPEKPALKRAGFSERGNFSAENGPDVSLAQSPAALAPRRVVAEYDYVDEAGELLFQVVRYAPKDFRQRRPDHLGGWLWGRGEERLVPYRLPDLLDTLGRERLIFVVEGEKAVEALRAAGIPATCSPGGACKWPGGFADWFYDSDVVILPDNDDPGRRHADMVGASLAPVARSVRVLELPLIPEKGDAADWLEAGGDAEVLYDLVDRVARPWLPPAPQTTFRAVWLRDAATLLANPTWLVDGLLTTGDMAMIYGATASGKSFFALHLALNLARGEPIFTQRVRKAAGVVYVAAEGKQGFGKRLRAYLKRNGLPPDEDLPFVLIPEVVDLFARDTAGGHTAKLIADVLVIKAAMAEAGTPLGLIVIDTLAAVTPGANENASEDMSRILQHCRRIQEQCGVAVTIVHHMDKAETGPRGHTGLLAACENAIEIDRDPETNERTAIVAKLKDGEDGQKLAFHLDVEGVGFDEEGEPITSCVIEPGRPARSVMGGKVKVRAGPVSPIARPAWAALNEALAEGLGIKPPPFGTAPAGVPEVLGLDRWREVFGRSRQSDEKPNTRNVALKRGADWLHEHEYIGRTTDYVWLR